MLKCRARGQIQVTCDLKFEKNLWLKENILKVNFNFKNVLTFFLNLKFLNNFLRLYFFIGEYINISIDNKIVTDSYDVICMNEKSLSTF